MAKSVQGDLTVLLRWNGSDFEPLGKSKLQFDDTRDSIVYIHETSRTMLFRIGVGESSISKRIISRRFDSIAKTGYQYSEGIRLGHGFNVILHEGELDLKKMIKGLNVQKTKEPQLIKSAIARRTTPKIKKTSTGIPSEPSNHEAIQLGLLVYHLLSEGDMLLIKPSSKGPVIQVLKVTKEV